MRPLIITALCLLVAASVSSAQVPAAQTGAARDLPSTVLAAFEKAYPSAAITGSSQEREDGEVAFRVDAVEKSRRIVVMYDVNGGVIQSAEQINEADLPKAVMDTVRAQSKKASFVRGMKVVRGTNVHYELTLRGTRKSTLVVKPNGALVTTK